MSDDLTKRFPSGQDGDSARLQRLEEQMGKLIEVVQGLTTELRAELGEVKTRLEAVEKIVTDRSYDTKPIWERALAEIAETRAELAETRAEFRAELAETRAEFRAELGEMHTEMREGFRKLNKQMEVLAKDVLEVRADERILERRLDNLESKVS